MTTPPVIIGSGLAGLCVALGMAPRPVIVLTSHSPGQESSSILAQGGIAAALGDDDSPSLHADDTFKAGACHGDRRIIDLVTQSAPAAIRQLIDWGVDFDRATNGAIDLCLEGGHSRRRIVHANGDSTGASVTKALVARAQRTPSITFIDDAVATSLRTNAGGIAGLSYARGAQLHTLATDNVILATGGIGALWPHTTNPRGSWGRGLLLAARAGAALRDLEFMQFHPTGIDVGLNPMPLASESLRGEGARLVNDAGDFFMKDVPGQELAPRDIVARAIWQQMMNGRRVLLDARMIPSFACRFPTIYRLCLGAGLDPTRAPIPVRPTAHYHMGGVATNQDGGTTVRGLWACGEVACTGLHGANRLASNSLLEAVVFGLRIAGALRNQAAVPPTCLHSKVQNLCINPTSNDHQPPEKVHKIMENRMGVLRDFNGLLNAQSQLLHLSTRFDSAAVALMLVEAALARQESLGAHYLTDPALLRPRRTYA